MNDQIIQIMSQILGFITSMVIIWWLLGRINKKLTIFLHFWGTNITIAMVIIVIANGLPEYFQTMAGYYLLGMVIGLMIVTVSLVAWSLTSLVTDK